MFDPSKLSKQKEEKVLKRKAYTSVKEWCLQCVPPDIQIGLMIDVKEVVCGDPSCSPVDTVITLVWKDGGRGIFALPLEPTEITQEDVMEMFPVGLLQEKRYM